MNVHYMIMLVNFNMELRMYYAGTSREEQDELIKQEKEEEYRQVMEDNDC